MILISKIEIDGFRSIRKAVIDGLGTLTVFAGLNNSGKSNVLRALNAFFNSETDPGQFIDVDRDYFRPDLTKKKRKRIRIAVTFSLPANFRFRAGLQTVELLLGGSSFTIGKDWTRGRVLPTYSLNGTELGLDDQQRVDQFLQLIKFRYIPNRVVPTEVIRSEHQSLRDVLVRRLARHGKRDKAAFDAIRDTSEKMIKSLAQRFARACPGQGEVRLATPSSWHDMAFAFGYRLSRGGIEIDDDAQGSGIQSLLMLETLYLIDRDYFQQFGWRQAAIWGIEEPESSLHTSLEAQVAAYLAQIAREPSNRLQILCTSHSDLILQYAEKVVVAEQRNGESVFGHEPRARDALDRLCRSGVSRWVHPLLFHPLDPLVLVEGKYDCVFLEEAWRLLAPTVRVCVSYVERLQGGDATGGDKHLLRYIRSNADAIKARSSAAPVVVLLDWDSARRATEFKKGFTASDPYHVMVWSDSAFNPNLDRSFHGIERVMSDRIIHEADRAKGIVAKKRDGTMVIPRDADYDSFKAAVAAVVKRGIVADDLVHAKEFLTSVLQLVSSQEAQP